MVDHIHRRRLLGAFPLLWGGIVLVISKGGGWSRLAELYSAGDREPGGARHSKLTLTVYFAKERFFLEKIPLFQIGCALEVPEIPE